MRALSVAWKEREVGGSFETLAQMAMVNYKKHDAALVKLRRTNLTSKSQSAVAKRAKEISALVAVTQKEKKKYLAVVREWKEKTREGYYAFIAVEQTRQVGKKSKRGTFNV